MSNQVPNGTTRLDEHNSSTNSQDLPSHAAIDNFNSARQNPRYLVLDDINIDIFTTGAITTGLILVFFLHLSAFFTFASIAAILIPIRSILPKSTKPTGVALVTGASSGIGAELVYILAENGSDLILVGRDEDQLNAVRENVKKRYNRNAAVVSIDLSVSGAPQRLYNSITQQGYTVDILVNAAGLGHGGDVMEQPVELSERMIMLNCVALVQLTRLFGADMVKRGRGWMLQFSSIVGWMTGPGQNIYHSTKHLVRSFSEGLSVELRGTGVHNTQLMPGPVHTQFATRGHLDETFTFSSSGAVEDPVKVARAGYNGLCKNKRMVFSSWNAAVMATSFNLMPRSVHLTIGSLMNTPTPKTQMDAPKKRQ